MKREDMYVLLHKERACLTKQINKECDGKCKECIYACSPESIIEMCDTLISMYRPKKGNRK